VKPAKRSLINTCLDIKKHLIQVLQLKPNLSRAYFFNCEIFGLIFG
jgi:hypothetical protein